MDEIIESVGHEVTDGTMRAREIHAEIVASKKQVAIGIYELAQGLKIMRDEELFRELGCGDFAAYCEKMAKVNVSQAYKYIKVYEELGATALQSAGSMGIEKLFLITQLPPAERCDAIAEPETIEGMSVKELRAFVAKARQQGEQLTFLQNEAEAADTERRESEEKYLKIVDDLKARLEAAESEKEEEIERLKEAHLKEMKKVRVDTARIIEEMSAKHAEEKSGRRPDTMFRNMELDQAREEGMEAARAEAEKEIGDLKGRLADMSGKVAASNRTPFEERKGLYIDQVEWNLELLERLMWEGVGDYEPTDADRKNCGKAVQDVITGFFRNFSSEKLPDKTDLDEFRKRGSR